MLRHPQGEFAVEGESTADGAFVLERVPGVVGARVFVTAAGFGPRLIRDVHVPPNDRRDFGTIELERGTPVAGRVLTMLGAPIAGVEVALLEFVGPPPGMPQDFVTIFRELRRDDESLDQVITAADGTFTFAGAAPGRYLLVARKPGWQVRFTQPFTVAPPVSPSLEVRLVEGRGIRGIVKDQNGNGIAGAQLAALEFEPASTFISKSQKTTTGPDGRFAYASFGSGEVAIVVSARGFSGMSRSNIRPGGKEVEFVLRKAARFEGRVYDRATGKGLPGAAVIAFQLTASAALDETRSGPDGAYVLEAGPTGENVSVFAKLPGWTPAGLADLPHGQGAPNPMSGLKAGVGQDDIDAGAAIRRDLPMVAGGSISGRVIDGASGEGIAGADVTVVSSSSLVFFGLSEPVLTRTGADGSFTASPVGAGEATIGAAADGYLGTDEARDPNEPLPEGEERPPGHSVDVAPGAALKEVTVRLTRGLELPVLVNDPGGNPMPGATVTWVMPREQLAGVFGPMKRPRTASTDASGKVRLRGLPPRPEIVVAARHPSFPTGGHAEVDLRSPPKDLTIWLVRGASVAGVLLDADDRPAADRAVTFRHEKPETERAFGEWTEASHRCVTDVSGRFVIENLPPGPGAIVVEPVSRFDQSAEKDDCLEHGRLKLTLGSGKREDVRLRLVRGQSITGTVFDAAGKRAANITVYTQAEGPDASGFASAQTAEDGTYRLEGLCPGSYRVAALAPARNPGESDPPPPPPPPPEIRTVAAGSTGVDFRLTK